MQQERKQGRTSWLFGKWKLDGRGAAEVDRPSYVGIRKMRMLQLVQSRVVAEQICLKYKFPGNIQYSQ